VGGGPKSVCGSDRDRREGDGAQHDGEVLVINVGLHGMVRIEGGVVISKPDEI
jgi:hypothetical protein